MIDLGSNSRRKTTIDGQLESLTPAMKQFQNIGQGFRRKTSENHAQSSLSLVSVYRVGEPFRRGHCNWPEGAQFTYGPGGLELTLFHGIICEDVVADVQSGPAEFALIADLPVMVLAYRFGESISWDDVLYSWHLQPVCSRVIPSVDHSSEARVLLWISLVGANDGIIHAQRGMMLSPSFTFALQHAIRAQAMTSFDSEECASAISRLYLQHSRIVDRLSLAVVRTMGNE